MDRKIDKAKERAAAESRPKVLRPEDQRRLDDIQARIKGEWGGRDGKRAGARWVGRGRSGARGGGALPGSQGSRSVG
jgi:hypothetical protein